MKGISVALLLCVVVLGNGCGSGGTAEDTGEPPPARAEADQSATATADVSRRRVIEVLGVTSGRDENGVPNSDRRAGCYAFKIFATPEDNMQAYIEIGDPVATNPSETVGAVVGTYKGVPLRKCVRLFERRLAKLG